MVTPLRVLWYRAAWSVPQKVGSITLVFQTQLGQQESHITGLTAEELHSLTSILRNERPIYWDAQNQMFYTGNEMVGEEEVD